MRRMYVFFSFCSASIHFRVWKKYRESELGDLCVRVRLNVHRARATNPKSASQQIETIKLSSVK